MSRLLVLASLLHLVVADLVNLDSVAEMIVDDMAATTTAPAPTTTTPAPTTTTPAPTTSTPAPTTSTPAPTTTPVPTTTAPTPTTTTPAPTSTTQAPTTAKPTPTTTTPSLNKTEHAPATITIKTQVPTSSATTTQIATTSSTVQTTRRATISSTKRQTETLTSTITSTITSTTTSTVTQTGTTTTQSTTSTSETSSTATATVTTTMTSTATMTTTMTVTTSTLTTTVTSTTTTSETSTITTSQTSSTTTTTAYCFENDVQWSPVDMANVAPREVDDVFACQRKCLQQPGCSHFSFWKDTGLCHLQDRYAQRRENRPGYISGPFQCWSYLVAGEYTMHGNTTYLPKEFRCMQIGISWAPDMPGAPSTTLQGSRDEVTFACQQRCLQTEGCAHFTMMFPGLCRLSDGDATPLPAVSAISGPPTQECADDNSIDPMGHTWMKKYETESVGFAGKSSSASPLSIFAACALAAAVASAAVVLRTQRRSLFRMGSSSFDLEEANPLTLDA